MSAQSNHKAPEIIARGVLTRGSSVLVCRNLAKGYMYLPGGHVEPGETSAEALAREFGEETGLAIKVGECQAVSEVLFGQGGHEINLVFHVEHPGELGDSVESKEDDIGFEWLEHAAIVDADLRPRSIKAWLVGGGDPAAQGIEFISDRQDD